ncbi:DUF2281 domain-containing protein [Runella sp. SP2]|uniref:type II toxin-antitoxin system VapB family antitoxin n=1 Tax=Runella sp. SP2 TaxID=2268026 RepID=UPI000F083742|nr:DUF2281 domain-containing protein [Runella sp. SP2]AYQ36371.1 DUF2281 domain-containing protein [Runella sp. SP2]
MVTEKKILAEIYQLPESLKLEVLHFVTFLKQNQNSQKVETKKKERVFGLSKGKYKMSDDFSAPLDDFNDYM